MNLLLSNVRALLAGEDLESCDIRIRDGRFAEVSAPGSLHAESGEGTVDTAGCIVLPGMVDGHVHFDDPGYTWRETFATGTRAAAAGGVTTIVDMPCTSIPPVVSARRLNEKLTAVSHQAHVDFMFWGGLCANLMETDSDWRTQLECLAAEGIAAVKVYLLSGMSSFRELSDKQLQAAARACRELGLPVGVHSEDRDTVDQLTSALEPGLDPAEAWFRTRSGEAEEVAVRRVIQAAEETGATMHVVHLGSGRALDQIMSARARNVNISAESAPHYLSFTWQDLQRLGSLLKTAPVVKTDADRRRLWAGLAGEELAFVATDHAAGEWPREKQTGSFETDYGGIPGVELLLPWFHSEAVATGRVSLGCMGRMIASNPARFFGVDDRKGAIRQGLDADFVLLDPEAEWVVRSRELHNLNRYTPFEGCRFTGRVEQTWLRGKCVYQRKAANEYPAGATGCFQRRAGRLND